MDLHSIVRSRIDMAAAIDLDPEHDAALAARLDDPQEVLAVILDPKRRGTLYPYLHRLRDLAPVLRTDQATGRPAWVVTRYADVRAALSILMCAATPEAPRCSTWVRRGSISSTCNAIRCSFSRLPSTIMSGC